MVTWPFMMASSGAYRIPRWEGFVISADTDWWVDLAGEGIDKCSLSFINFVESQPSARLIVKSVFKLISLTTAQSDSPGTEKKIEYLKKQTNKSWQFLDGVSNLSRAPLVELTMVIIPRQNIKSDRYKKNSQGRRLGISPCQPYPQQCAWGL